MKYLIILILISVYHFFIPWKIKKNISFAFLILGIILVIYGFLRGTFNIKYDLNGTMIKDSLASDLVIYGIGLIVLHFFTIMTSKGAWENSKGIEGYNTSKRLIQGKCSHCNKNISRTAKVCPHCTTELF
jgi:hypothetical protein